MIRPLLSLVLLSGIAAASEIEVPLGGRTPVRPPRAIQEIMVRDPSLLTVVVTDGSAVSLEGKKSGTTGVVVTYVDGEIEHVLVVIGDGTNSDSPQMEKGSSVDLKRLQATPAQAKASPPPPKAISKERAAI